MYAIARLNTFDPDKLAVAGDSLQQFDETHAAQPGYLGSVVIDLQAGRRLALNLWESEQHATAALAVLGPEVGRLLNPLMASPSELLGAGAVVSTDLIRSPGS